MPTLLSLEAPEVITTSGAASDDEVGIITRVSVCRWKKWGFGDEALNDTTRLVYKLYGVSILRYNHKFNLHSCRLLSVSIDGWPWFQERTEPMPHNIENGPFFMDTYQFIPPQILNINTFDQYSRTVTQHHACFGNVRLPLSVTDPFKGMTHNWCTQSSNKQRVLMHRHQGLNVRHGLCHIYMRYLYIYELFIAFVCFDVCSLL